MLMTQAFTMPLNLFQKLIRLLNADLEALKGWLEGNKLSLNVAKTDAMIIGSNGKLRKIDSVDSTKPQFKIGSEDIKLVKEVK